MASPWHPAPPPPTLPPPPSAMMLRPPGTVRLGLASDYSHGHNGGKSFLFPLIIKDDEKGFGIYVICRSNKPRIALNLVRLVLIVSYGKAAGHTSLEVVFNLVV